MDNLRKRRIELGLSQEELAEMAGVTKQAVSKHEKGSIEASGAVLALYAKALQCSTDYLLGLKDEIA